MSKTSSVHPMIATAAANAGIRMAQIEAVANHLADLMRQAHGGRWRVQIEHEHGFVMVAERPQRSVDKSNNGEN